MTQLLRRLIREDDGQDIIEYVLIAAAISVIAIPIVPQIGTAVQNAWTYVQTQTGLIPTAGGAGGGGGT
jgi:Flp pilus assembly pilin Flp